MADAGPGVPSSSQGGESKYRQRAVIFNCFIFGSSTKRIAWPFPLRNYER